MQLEVETAAGWWKLLAGLAVVFVVFHVLAQALGSDRGQAGIVVGAVVVGALLAVESLLFRQAPASALQSLGFGRPTTGVLIAAAVCAALLAVIPVYAYLRDAPLVAHPDWPWLLPGLFAQAGIAEEACAVLPFAVFLVRPRG